MPRLLGFLISLVLVLAAPAALPAAASVAPAPVFEPVPCRDEALAKARCGVVRVPEDRGHPGGRKLALHVVIIPALPGPPGRAPQFDFEGGPGLAATMGASFYLSDGAAYREGRDVVLIDQRGAGGSSPLACPGLAPHGAAPSPLYPPEAVAACARAFTGKADTRRYTTHDLTADTDAVRAALGYPRIDIFAVSYGTTLALRYMADYPGRVRAVMLYSTVPAGATPPREHATAAQRALAHLFKACSAEAACAKAFPDLGGDVKRVLARLSRPGAAFSGEVFMERIRTLLYAPGSARRVPLIIHRAAEGDFAPFLKGYGRDGPPLMDGLYLSVTCAESFGHFDYPAAAMAARGTLFGDYRLRRQRAACANWPSGRVQAGFFAPVRSDAAVLMISGEDDPVSPLAWAMRAVTTLPNGRLVIVPRGGHLLDGMAGLEDCFDPVILAFYAAGSARNLDTGCLTGLKAPPFVITE